MDEGAGARSCPPGTSLRSLRNSRRRGRPGLRRPARAHGPERRVRRGAGSCRQGAGAVPGDGAAAIRWVPQTGAFSRLGARARTSPSLHPGGRSAHAHAAPWMPTPSARVNAHRAAEPPLDGARAAPEAPRELRRVLSFLVQPEQSPVVLGRPVRRPGCPSRLSVDPRVSLEVPRTRVAGRFHRLASTQPPDRQRRVRVDRGIAAFFPEAWNETRYGTSGCCTR